MDLAAMMGRKEKIVQTMTKGIEGLLKGHDVAYFAGTGKIVEPGKVAVNGEQVLVLKVLEVVEEETIMGNPMYVPQEDRYGAASRRPWQLDEEQQLTVLWKDVLCLVDLDETGCLTQGSLERLRRLGLEVDGGPQTH